MHLAGQEGLDLAREQDILSVDPYVKCHPLGRIIQAACGWGLVLRIEAHRGIPPAPGLNGRLVLVAGIDPEKRPATHRVRFGACFDLVESRIAQARHPGILVRPLERIDLSRGIRQPAAIQWHIRRHPYDEADAKLEMDVPVPSVSRPPGDGLHHFPGREIHRHPCTAGLVQMHLREREAEWAGRAGWGDHAHARLGDTHSEHPDLWRVGLLVGARVYGQACGDGDGGGEEQRRLQVAAPDRLLSTHARYPLRDGQPWARL